MSAIMADPRFTVRKEFWVRMNGRVHGRHHRKTTPRWVEAHRGMGVYLEDNSFRDKDPIAPLE
jgi:hypothetical protein